MTTKRIAIIIGAGFSKAAGWPDTSAILDEGAWLVTGAQAARYKAVWDTYASWKTGAASPSGDAFMAEVEAGRVAGVSWGSVVEVVAGTIASVGADISPLVSPRYADSLMRPNKHPSHQAFFGEALALADLTGVVSLNYDLLAEKVLRTEPMRRPRRPGFYYGGLPRPQVCIGRSSSPFPRDRAKEPLTLTGAVPIWKPHGSLNWHRQWNEIALYPDLRAAFRGQGEAAIVPPVAVEDAVPSWLTGIWAGAADLLGSVEEWWVAGYSLPDADVALKSLFHVAARAGALERVYVRNKTTRTRPKWEGVAGTVPVEYGRPL